MSESKTTDSDFPMRNIIKEDIRFGHFGFYQIAPIEIPVPGLAKSTDPWGLTLKYDHLISKCVPKFFNGGTYEGKIWATGPMGSEVFTEKLLRLLISCIQQDEETITGIIAACLPTYPRLSNEESMVDGKSVVIDAIFDFVMKLHTTSKYPQAMKFLTNTGLL